MVRDYKPKFEKHSVEGMKNALQMCRDAQAKGENPAWASISQKCMSVDGIQLLGRAPTKDAIRVRFNQEKTRGEPCRDAVGRPPVMAMGVQNQLAAWIRKGIDARLPPNRFQIIIKASKIALALGLRFGENLVPGYDWLKNFLDSHSIIIRKGLKRSITKLDKQEDKPHIDKYGDDFEEALNMPINPEGASSIQQAAC